MGTVCVLGGGSFGTALADLLARQGLTVHQWLRDASRAEEMRRTRRNPEHLSELEVHAGIEPTADLTHALAGVDWVLMAIPSPAVRSVLEAVRPLLAPIPLMLATKGIENDTLMTMHEVALDVLGPSWAHRLLALSGPSFAREVMLGYQTAVVIASQDAQLADWACRLMFTDAFRPYSSTDIIGVEMGGALKNVMAIAAGAITGLKLGDNTRAALITRGLAEITRLAVAKGAHPMTLAGLAGVGDLVLTCTGALSRNRRIGQLLGEGKSLTDAIAEVKEVAEGVRTTKSAYALAQKLGVDAPITSAIYNVIYGDLEAREALLGLSRRELKREREY
ncbi:MAG: NAD(P)H-dependent glycerol-3-phosphate dehydrogenase [Myxococcota bacterium]